MFAKCLEAGHLYRRTVQLLEALQIVNGGDASSEAYRERYVPHKYGIDTSFGRVFYVSDSSETASNCFAIAASVVCRS